MREQDASAHELADALLPWFVNGTLSREERAMVESHAAGCDECRDNIALLERVRNASAMGQPIPMVPHAKPDALLNAIDARQAQRRRWRCAWLAGVPLAASIVAAAILLPARNPSPEGPLPFRTAMSDSDPLTMDYVFSVRFERGASPLEHERGLEKMGAREFSAMHDPSVYRVVVALPVESLEDLERYRERMESLPGVQAVQAVALQLPVNRPQ